MGKGTIGFIGLGNIGKPMAERLAKTGFNVVTCAHVRREAIEELKNIGVVEAESPYEVAAKADILMTIVRDENESEKVILEEGGALDGMRKGTAIIIMSTVTPGFCQKVASAAKEKSVSVLDSPVSGGRVAAAEGKLSMMVGGEIDVFKQCFPYLQAFGEVIYCGELGAGMAAKLANNAVLHGTIGLVAETLSFGKAYGIKEKLLLEVFKKSSANSWTVQQWDLIQGQWDLAMKNGKKDAISFLDVAKSKDIKLALAEAVKEYYKRQK